MFRQGELRNFIPASLQVPVYAGLIPPDTRVLTIVPSAYLCTYFTGFISSLLNIPRYAIDVADNSTDVPLTTTARRSFS